MNPVGLFREVVVGKLALSVFALSRTLVACLSIGWSALLVLSCLEQRRQVVFLANRCCVFVVLFGFFWVC